jgi:quercetin dioxygenase-like cupin family protein
VVSSQKRAVQLVRKKLHLSVQMGAINSPMENQRTIAPAISIAGRAPVLRAFGDEVIVHLGAKETGGRFTMFTDTTPPGGGPPPHYHITEDEWFLVLEGRASFLNNGEWTEVPAGSAVFMPKGCVHTFKNIGNTPLKQIITTSPAGFEEFFSKCAEEFSKPGNIDMNRIAAIGAEHDIHFVEV